VHGWSSINSQLVRMFTAPRPPRTAGHSTARSRQRPTEPRLFCLLPPQQVQRTAAAALIATKHMCVCICICVCRVAGRVATHVCVMHLIALFLPRAELCAEMIDWHECRNWCVPLRFARKKSRT
jgi:hypothetical protein